MNLFRFELFSTLSDRILIAVAQVNVLSWYQEEALQMDMDSSLSNGNPVFFEAENGRVAVGDGYPNWLWGHY